MPPSGVRRPEPAVYKSMITWLEGELDRAAVPYTPPPGLHRFNRTEYGNAIRDLLGLEVPVWERNAHEFSADIDPHCVDRAVSHEDVSSVWGVSERHAHAAAHRAARLRRD